MDNTYLKRIKYTGQLDKLIEKALQNYDIGSLVECKVIEVGYEDLNIQVEASNGMYFMKFYSQVGTYAKTLDDCRRYIKNILEAMKVEVNHPMIIMNTDGNHLSAVNIEGGDFYYSIQEFVESTSNDAYTQEFNEKDLHDLGKMIGSLHLSKYRPPHYYDDWAIENFSKEFEDKKKYLEEPDLPLLSKVDAAFRSIDFDRLPKSFIHGDVISTNIIRSKDSGLMLIDFSVANYTYRLAELAFIGCSATFNPKQKERYSPDFKIFLESYLEVIKLTDYELEILPIFIDVGHAAHVLLSSYEIASKEEYFDEDYYWRDLGRRGLEIS